MEITQEAILLEAVSEATAPAAAAVAVAERAAAVREAVPTGAAAAAAVASLAVAVAANASAAKVAATSSAALVVCGEGWLVGAGVTAGVTVWTDAPDEDNKAPAGHATGRLWRAAGGRARMASIVSEGMKASRSTPGAVVAERMYIIAM